MGSRIVVFGATGYTGGLVVNELAGRDVDLVVAGRNATPVQELAKRVGAEPIVADAAAPTGSLSDHLAEGDVLVSTVGPFVRLGAPAVEAALRAGAHYVDSTGEGAFVRRVFTEWGPVADGRSLLLTAFGYDFVPGNLAAGLALREAGPDATRVDVGYFMRGQGDPRSAISSGTLATIATMATTPGYTLRGGELVPAPTLPAGHTFTSRGKDFKAMAIPGVEHFDVPAVFDHVIDLDVHVGWAGPATPALRAAFAGGKLANRIPGVSRLLRSGSRRLAGRTGIGPDADERAKSTSLVLAEASAPDGTVLARTRLEGPNGYTLTGALIAWAAQRLATDPPDVTGAAGPLRAFGLDELASACASLGLVEVDG